MNPGTKVKTPRGLGVLENIQDDGTCVVRLINQTEWPFPEWIFVQRNQVKLVFPASVSGVFEIILSLEGSGFTGAPPSILVAGKYRDWETDRKSVV